MTSYQNYIQQIHRKFLETSNWLSSFKQFQFGTLYHFWHHYMTGGSSSELIRLKEDRALGTRVHLASLKRTFGAISERINELKWTKTYSENAHARDSRNQMLNEWLPQAFLLCFCSLYKQKMDMDISSNSSSSDKDTAIGAYWESNIGLPFTDRVSEEEF